MQQMVQGGKDTKGALRLTSYMAAYKNAVVKQISGRSGNGTGATASDLNPQPRSAYDLFKLCLDAATAKDKPVFFKLLDRAEVEYQKWLPAEPAPATEAAEVE